MQTWPINLTMLANVTVDNVTSILTVEVYEDWWQQEESISVEETVYIPVVFGVLLLMGLVGNGLVVYVVVYDGPCRSVSNIYLLSIAVSDLCFLVSSLPFTAALHVLPTWHFGENMCRIVNSVIPLSMGCSVMTMALISVDQYCAVAKSIETKMFRTVRYTAVCVLVIWLVNCGGAVPQWLLSKLVVVLNAEDAEQLCFCVLYFTTTATRRIYTLAIFAIFYVLPLLTISLSYAAMARYLWLCTRLTSLPDDGLNRCKQHHKYQARSSTSAKIARRRCRVMRTVLAIVAAFTVCWLPIHVVNIVNDFVTPTAPSLLYYVIKICSYALAYVSSSINPVIYAFVSQTFRQSARAAFVCRHPSLAKAFDTPVQRSRCQKSTPDIIVTL